MNQLVLSRTFESSPGRGGRRPLRRVLHGQHPQPQHPPAYTQAVSESVAWCELHCVPSITAVQPVHVAGYIEEPRKHGVCSTQST
jgi:hypothetical protein